MKERQPIVIIGLSAALAIALLEGSVEAARELVITTLNQLDPRGESREEES